MSQAIPNLKIDLAVAGTRSAPVDFGRLLYVGGAAWRSTPLKRYTPTSSPIRGRLPIVEAFHNVIVRLAEESKATAKAEATILFAFVKWLDGANGRLCRGALVESYLLYISFCKKRAEQGQISEGTLYSIASGLGRTIDRALMRPQGLSLREAAVPSIGKPVRTAENYQSDQGLYEFGPSLLDLRTALDGRAIFGPIPVRINFRSGKTLVHWCGMNRYSEDEEAANTPLQKWGGRRRSTSPAIPSVLNRRSLINLRIEAEMHIFLAQTGMNLAQARALRRGEYSYQSYLDGYKVRKKIKGRRGGDVEFQIYSGYRPLFEEYLDFLKELLPNTGLLFPFIGTEKNPAGGYRTTLKRHFNDLAIPYVPPQRLRGTRTNYIRKKINEPRLSAQMAQHAQGTHDRAYARLSEKTAMVEISRFHASNSRYRRAAGPGGCGDGKAPVLKRFAPVGAPVPNCWSAAGCMFCANHRHIASQDHVWSIATYRYLKTVELSGARPRKGNGNRHPSQLVIEEITSFLQNIVKRGGRYREWVEEASVRVIEGHFHPDWVMSITRAERL